MLISLSSLAAVGKIQKNIFKTKVRPVGLIDINTKELTNYTAIYESGLLVERW